ncbi:hypothetical protein E6C50_01885 [Flavobacterium supellecticarium]|uniref:Uncharacterized protein n=1 Tax=Flavobacterium supellecticarium TaxID=2565924 RepID=A0A4S4A3J4_9FLAO|nr:hypothetical protein [Flavobacterium supellecticarium]THF52982.1 hypothetical protein E6C50_01885 [Flavobacterium supellecticarium]
MLNQFTWIDYFIGICVAMVIYYLWLAIKYFRNDITHVILSKSDERFGSDLFEDEYQDVTEVKSTSAMQEGTAILNTLDNDFEEIEFLIQKLKKVIADTSKSKPVKAEFKEYLRLVLKEYPSVKDSALRESVNELIVAETEKYGIVILSREEVDVLW